MLGSALAEAALEAKQTRMKNPKSAEQIKVVEQVHTVEEVRWRHTKPELEDTAGVLEHTEVEEVPTEHTIVATAAPIVE